MNENVENKDVTEPAFPPAEAMSPSVEQMAFPGRVYQSREWWTGMTLRDYFAAKAMSAQIIAGEADEDGEKIRTSDDLLAAWSYKTADAMMKARKK